MNKGVTYGKSSYILDWKDTRTMYTRLEGHSTTYTRLEGCRLCENMVSECKLQPWFDEMQKLIPLKKLYP